MSNIGIYSTPYYTTGTSTSATTYTIPASAWSNVTLSTSPSNGTWATTQGGKIELKGESADVVINGESLKETLQAIKEALRIPNRIQQDAKLEQDFEEIKTLREKYEQKVKEYQEQKRVWDILKNTD